jgi:threonine dehydratase
LTLLEREKILAEGAGAVPVGALIDRFATISKGSKVVLVISGGNVDAPLLNRILKKGLIRNGRLMKLAVNLEDIPGSLARLLSLIAKLKANVLQIDHRRNEEDLPIYVSRVALELETRGWDHLKEVAEGLRQAGYAIELQYGPENSAVEGMNE